MTARKWFLLVIVLLEWFSLIAQFILQQQAATVSRGESLIRFFNYFTILTNLLIGIYVTVQLMTPERRRSGFFFRPSVETACTLYILVVGLVFNIILRFLGPFTGLQLVVSEIHHTIVPLMILLYWWRWVDTRSLTYRHIPAWLIYPAAYAVFVMVRGSFGHWYPYPFLNVDQLGYAKVMVNIVILVGVFLVFALGFVWVGRRKKM